MQVRVREFRGHLNTYLQAVERGTAVQVTARGRVVAELHGPGDDRLSPGVPGAMRSASRLAGDHMRPVQDLLAEIVTAISAEREV